MRTSNPLADKFDRIFDKKLVSAATHYDAYEEAEEEFSREHNHRKYSSFDSYRKVRSRRIKKGK